jgi:hypothetical protein
MKKDFQKELFHLRGEMIDYLKNHPLYGIEEKIDVVDHNWDGDFLRTVTIVSVNEDGEAVTDNEVTWDLEDVIIEDLAYLCNYDRD